MRKILTLLMGCCLLFSLSLSYAVTPKNWTFLIFINGNNSLDAWGAKNIMQMEKVGSNDQVNVVVQWASKSANKAVRLLAEKSTDPTKVTSPILEDLGPTDMGDYHTLQDFIAWGVKNYPAKHYFIDVWNHGNGWHFSKVIKGKPRNLGDISYDDLSGHFITTEQLADVMAYSATLMGHKVDIYGSDACLMAMMEVANQMSNSVKYYAGSEEVEPGAGWPYDTFLARWEAIPNARADQVASILTDAYVKSYEDGSSGSIQEVTFSAFDLSKIADLNKAISKFGLNLQKLNKADVAKVLEASINTQRFMSSDYADLMDFTQKLTDAGIVGLDLKNLLLVRTYAKKFIIANATTSTYKKAGGASIWIPETQAGYDEYATRYNKLNFNVNTSWGETLKKLLQGS